MLSIVFYPIAAVWKYAAKAPAAGGEPCRHDCFNMKTYVWKGRERIMAEEGQKSEPS